MAPDAIERISTLRDPALFRQQCYVDGKWIDADSGATHAVVNPATGRQFSMDAIPASALFPTPANAGNWPWYPGTAYVASAGRNIFRVQGQNNLDAAFIKNTRLFGHDRAHYLQFRAEMFNLFNRVQFDVPNLTLVDTGVARAPRPGEARPGPPAPLQPLQGPVPLLRSAAHRGNRDRTTRPRPTR